LQPVQSGLDVAEQARRLLAELKPVQMSQSEHLNLRGSSLAFVFSPHHSSGFHIEAGNHIIGISYDSVNLSSSNQHTQDKLTFNVSSPCRQT